MAKDKQKFEETLVQLNQSAAEHIIVDLDNEELTKDDTQKLVAILAAKSVPVTLSLRHNKLRLDCIKFLVKKDRLTALDVSDSEIAEMGGILLASHESLVALNMSHTQIDDVSAMACATNENLRHLVLSHNKLPAMLSTFLTFHRSLQSLDLSHCDLDTKEAMLFGGAKCKSLNLSHNRLTGEAVIGYAKNTTITELDLSHNNIGKFGMAFLPFNTSLTTLNLSHNGIEGRALFNFATNNTLIKLDLSHNPLGDVGASQIAENARFTTLNLSHCGIGRPGLACLMNNKTLTSLTLNGNPLSDDDVLFLTQNETLTSLVLDNDTLSEASREAIAAMLKHNNAQVDKFLAYCGSNSVTEVQRLITEGKVSPYTQNTDSKDSGLHIAVAAQCREVFAYLVKEFPELVKQKNKLGKTPLQIAEELGNVAIVAKLKNDRRAASHTRQQMHTTSLAAAVGKSRYSSSSDSSDDESVNKAADKRPAKKSK